MQLWLFFWIFFEKRTPRCQILICEYESIFCVCHLFSQRYVLEIFGLTHREDIYRMLSVLPFLYITTWVNAYRFQKALALKYAKEKGRNLSNMEGKAIKKIASLYLAEGVSVFFYFHLSHLQYTKFLLETRTFTISNLNVLHCFFPALNYLSFAKREILKKTFCSFYPLA